MQPCLHTSLKPEEALIYLYDGSMVAVGTTKSNSLGFPTPSQNFPPRKYKNEWCQLRCANASRRCLAFAQKLLYKCRRGTEWKTGIFFSVIDRYTLSRYYTVCAILLSVLIIILSVLKFSLRAFDTGLLPLFGYRPFKQLLWIYIIIMLSIVTRFVYVHL